MSTEHQQYSTENQSHAIRMYAERRGIEIVRTYADEGRSGLRLAGREALTRLIADVQSGKADFEAILVDNSGDVRMAGWLQTREAERLRVVSLDPPLGFATAVNAGIEAAAGEVIVLFDPSVELTGDSVSPLLRVLDDPDRKSVV